MQSIILAGGLGTRLSEETIIKPKPMVEIGGKPVLWHVMKIYSHYGINDFVICLGYKGYLIKEYFANYFLHMSDVTFDIANNRMEVHQASAEPWRVTLVDTGDLTMTGGRLKRIRAYLRDEDFCFTYGDGLSNVDIKALIAFHKKQDTLATVASPAFARNRRVMVTGLTAGFSFFRPRCLITSTAMPPFGSGHRLNGWLLPGNCLPIATLVSFSPWIHCETECIWKNCGTRAPLLGKYGREPGILAGSAGFYYRAYRIQGKLARAVAEKTGCIGHRLCASRAYPSCSF